LLQSGEEQETAGLLRSFLGRPVSPQALLDQVRRISAPSAAATTGLVWRPPPRIRASPRLESAS
jgi:hypothetical protein